MGERDLLIETTGAAQYVPRSVGGQRASTRHAELAAYLAASCPQAAELFAEPVLAADGKSHDWYITHRGVHVVRLNALEPLERERASQELGEQLSDLRQRISVLRQRGGEDSLFADLLEGALHVASEDHVWWAGDHPVLTAWGAAQHGEAAQAHVLERLVSRLAPEVGSGSGAAPEPGASSAFSDGAMHGPAVMLVERRGFWPLWFVVAALLGVSFWHLLMNCALYLPESLGGRQLLGYCPMPVAASPAQSEVPALEERLHELRLELAREQGLCRPVEQAELLPQPEPEPEPEPQPEPEPEPETVCEEGQQAAEAREIAIVLDSSGSMADPFSIPPDLAQHIEDNNRQLQLAEQALRSGDLGAFLRIVEIKRQTTALEQETRGLEGRMSVAQRILRDAISNAPPDVAISLTSFGRCGAIREHGSYDPGNRGALIDELARLRPDSRTPLAEALERAARSIGSDVAPEDPVSILVISDGRETCDGDPCAVARAAKAARPGLVINVVDLDRTGELACVSEATGGFYSRSEGLDLDALARTVREAAGYEGRGVCR